MHQKLKLKFNKQLATRLCIGCRTKLSKDDMKNSLLTRNYKIDMMNKHSTATFTASDVL